MCVARNVINEQQSPLILYELIPPPAGLNPDEYKVYAECVVDVILNAAVKVNAINIPEIRDEQRGSDRTYTYLPKSDPREFGNQIKEICNGQLNVVVNRGTVYFDLAHQKEWLEQTLHQYKLHDVILVGGDSSSCHYPGPSVGALAQYIVLHYQTTMMCGGICIPTRRHSIAKKDEPYRMLEKIKAGIEYFTTQIIYDADSINRLLLDYNDLCAEQKIQPRRIILSFAPVSNEKDVTFMEWLGVKIPSAIKGELLKSSIAVGWRSLKHSLAVLESVCAFVKKNRLNVPLGINIEHINNQNFVLSKQFIDELGVVYTKFVSCL